MSAPATETAAQRRARLDHKNDLQRTWRANRKQAAASQQSAPPITVGATRAGTEPDAAPEKRKPHYTRAQRKAMQDRAALARAALARKRAEGIPLGKPKPKAKPGRVAAARMHDKAANLPVPFERVPRVRGEILDSGERLIERIPAANGHDAHGVDMGIVADLVLAIAAKLSRR